MLEEDETNGEIEETSPEDVEEEKKRIKELGLENISKDSFSRLYNGTKKREKEEKKPFRGFT